mmetsp:Transcript_20476/g.33677  ORF Transcript_20476/g.33677 Transcript_20476/m.33677 type:complete len:359 (-) Transcript_20476:311-1387(-)|eukprot:CAMPEP_0184666340 /NCGR_PEP_ID=MMETSP0308-20130426/61010_1 /TAXON_ID=38269 /ORGANISM="Gloeochaete witrockiana, Strain SAG 46.84" /LENGTH=358 /DNA_ID=CAMNT_0027110853 /DNA_START=471 /DNA_END=1547 /DNA_ORIENTATION=-
MGTKSRPKGSDKNATPPKKPLVTSPTRTHVAPSSSQPIGKTLLPVTIASTSQQAPIPTPVANASREAPLNDILPNEEESVQDDDSEGSKSDGEPIVQIDARAEKIIERQKSFVHPYQWADVNRKVLRLYGNATAQFSRYTSKTGASFDTCAIAVSAAVHGIKNSAALHVPFLQKHGDEAVVIFVDQADTDIAEAAKAEILALPDVKVQGLEGAIVNSIKFSDRFDVDPAPSGLKRYEPFPARSVICQEMPGTLLLDKACEILACYLNMPVGSVVAKFSMKNRVYKSDVIFGFNADFDKDIFPESFPVPADCNEGAMYFTKHSWLPPCRVPECYNDGTYVEHSFLECKRRRPFRPTYRR